MKILVTGGAGYVGSHAVRELSDAQHEVIVYDNLSTGHSEFTAGYPSITGDIANQDLLRDALKGVDAVMHFAASAYVGESARNPRKYFHNNVESALKLLDAVLASDVRLLVFSSSCAIYGHAEILPISESCRKEPINAYGATKIFFEHALTAYEHSHGLKHVCLRYFNAAGAHSNGRIGEFHEPETHLIPLALRAALGTGPMLQIFGRDFSTSDGTCVRDFIHVCDLAKAHVKAIEYLSHGGSSISLNLGTGVGTSIASLIGSIQAIIGCRVPHEFLPRRLGDPAALYADHSLARRVLGWKPAFGLTEILETAWDWECRGLPELMAAPSAHCDLISRLAV